VHLASGLILAGAVLVLSIGVGWHRPATRALRVIDLMLTVILGAVLLQMVPLPRALVGALSPVRDRFVAANALEPATRSLDPLTLSVSDTAHAALTLVTVVMTYWTARSLFSRGGLRTFSVIIAWGAIACAIVAFAQHAAGTPLVYGFWQPRDSGARPLGPFINRNHFGTWALMAMCVCLGYLLWRREYAMSGPTWRSRLASAFDGRGLTLHLAIVSVTAATALGASRSAFLALACAGVGFALYAAGIRAGRRARATLLIVGVLAMGGVLAYGDVDRLMLRLDETREHGFASRTAIWRDAVPAIRDYTLTGVGAGAFATAMRVYQTTPRTYYHNEAHNQYVQILTEGGVLLTVPVVISLVAFVVAARDRLRREDPLRWMRLASASALFGVAVQSLWETGLTVPANGMFAAALAGMLVHESRVSRDSAHSQRSG
jgi:O-antigen ligase